MALAHGLTSEFTGLSLTHWPLGDVALILKVWFLNSLCRTVVGLGWVFLRFGAVRQQAIILASVDPDLSQYLNLCCVDVNWTLKNKLQWNYNQNTKLFIHENAFETILCEMAAILPRERWVKGFQCWQVRTNLNQVLPVFRLTQMSYMSVLTCWLCMWNLGDVSKTPMSS